jgi:hypothetical protein
MADVGLFTLGVLIGTYTGLIFKKNNLRIIPQSIDLGKYGKNGDIAK